MRIAIYLENSFLSPKRRTFPEEGHGAFGQKLFQDKGLHVTEVLTEYHQVEKNHLRREFGVTNK